VTWVLTSLAILAAAALASLALARVPRLALIAAMLGVLSASILLIVAAGSVLLGASPAAACAVDWPLPLGVVRMVLDGLSAWFLMTIGVVTGCVAVYSVPYMGSGVGRASVPAFGALLCALLAALVLVVCAADAVLFLIGWEIMMLAAFLLVAFDHDRPDVRRGAWTYLIANHIGTALCVLPLFGVLTWIAGTTEFSVFSTAASSCQMATVVTMFMLGLLGFGTKAGFMPMHIWLPAAHPVAPTPASALLSGIVVKIGIYGLLRLLTWLPPLPAACSYLLLFFAIVSGVMGVLYALAQHELKRLLAYHTVENIGIIALGIGIGMLGQTSEQPALAALGYTRALLHVTNHALFKGLLFLSAGAVQHAAGTTDIERLGGLAKRTPVNAFMFLVGAVAICGLPPLNGFVSEWVIYGSLFGGAIRGVGGSGTAAVLGLVSLALMGGLALACFAKVFGVVFLGEPRDAQSHAHATPALMKIAMGGLALACLLIGVLPGLWLPLTQRVTSQLARSLPEAGVGSAMRSVLAPAATLTTLAAIFALVALGLVMIRRRTQARAAVRDHAEPSAAATWGCGYARPAARMQYTASSFAASLIGGFRTLLWPDRSLVAPAGAFPAAGRLETHAPDIAEHDLFRPLFRAFARLFAMVRTVSWSGEVREEVVAPVAAAEAVAAREHRRLGPVRTLLLAMVTALRRGSIQIYLAFIVVTLVVLFLIEALSSPPVARRPVVHDSSAISARVER
jgi:formate hydrogenlyase subunit 3/multisubunit Na+/H+ antiporter MnhD subunit